MFGQVHVPCSYAAIKLNCACCCNLTRLVLNKNLFIEFIELASSLFRVVFIEAEYNFDQKEKESNFSERPRQPFE